MGDYFVGEIRLLPYSRTPDGWISCEGQQLQVTQYQALFALIGNKFGGNGTTNFNLPDLRGRVPVGYGQLTQANLIGGSAGSQLAIGAAGGSEGITLSLAQVPAHTHSFGAQPDNLPSITITNAVASTVVKPSTLPSTAPAAPNMYATPGTLTALHGSSIAPYGGNAAHENRQPFLALRYCICATNGLFPPRN